MAAPLAKTQAPRPMGARQLLHPCIGQCQYAVFYGHAYLAGIDRGLPLPLFRDVAFELRISLHGTSCHRRAHTAMDSPCKRPPGHHRRPLLSGFTLPLLTPQWLGWVALRKDCYRGANSGVQLQSPWNGVSTTCGRVDGHGTTATRKPEAEPNVHGATTCCISRLEAGPGSYAIDTGIAVPVWDYFFAQPRTGTLDMGAVRH